MIPTIALSSALNTMHNLLVSRGSMPAGIVREPATATFKTRLGLAGASAGVFVVPVFKIDYR